MVERSTMNTSWLSTQLPQVMEGHTPVRWQLQEDRKLVGASHSKPLVCTAVAWTLCKMLCIHCALNCPGGSVVHSYRRLIPHEFPITDLQQISGPEGIGRVICTVGRGMPNFFANGGVLTSEGVSQTRNGATSTLTVNPSNVDSFQNRGLYCTNYAANFFYLSLSSASKCNHFIWTTHRHPYAYIVINHVYKCCFYNCDI